MKKKVTANSRSSHTHTHTHAHLVPCLESV